MNEYQINMNYIDIIAGTSNKVALAYTEAAKNISSDNDKSMKYLRNFLLSIENLSSKSIVKDSSISASAGNIKDFSGYDNIETSINFLKKNLGNIPSLSNMISIRDSLIRYQPEYSDGYRSKCNLVMVEYECAVYMLVTGLVEIMCTNVQFSQSGTKIVIKKKSGSTHGTISSVALSLAKELDNRNHKNYLSTLIKSMDNKGVDTSVDKVESKPSKKDLQKPLNEYGITIMDNGLDGYSFDVLKENYSDDTLDDIFNIVESYSTDKNCNITFYENDEIAHYEINGNCIMKESVALLESTVADVLNIIDAGFDTVKKGAGLVRNTFKTIKSSLFGIVPIIRSILFLRYKKKSDKINALEEQIKYIKMNIEQLQNRQGDISEDKKKEIIKKQQAIIERYNKQAEKLRAELMEEEKDAATDINNENPSMSSSNDDDDFVLEGKTISEIFASNKLSSDVGDSTFSLD